MVANLRWPCNVQSSSRYIILLLCKMSSVLVRYSSGTWYDIKALGMPQEFYHRFMYIAPSNDLNFLTLNLPLRIILRKYEVSRCLGWEWCTFQKIDENSFKSTNIMGFSHWHKITALIPHLIGGTKCGVTRVSTRNFMPVRKAHYTMALKLNQVSEIKNEVVIITELIKCHTCRIELG